MGKLSIILIVAIVVGANAVARVKRHWQSLPGYPTVFVDINSIRPANFGPPAEGGGVSPTDTLVDVRLDGHELVEMLSCELPLEKTPNENSAYWDQNVLIGYVPKRSIKFLVCPIKAKMHH